MSKKVRLVGAGVLTIVGTSSLVLSQVPGLGSPSDLKVSNIIPLPYVVAAMSLISLWPSLYTYPQRSIYGEARSRLSIATLAVIPSTDRS
jgi:hypothetical protein